MGKNQHVLLAVITALLKLSTLLPATRAAHLRRNTNHNSSSNNNVRSNVEPNENQQQHRILQDAEDSLMDLSISGYLFEPTSYYTDYEDASQIEQKLDEDSIDVQALTGGPFIGSEISINESDENNRDDMVVTKRIVGGSDAEPHPFHSMLLLKYGGGFRWAGCGGTLISNCHVLTAAHCAMDPSKPLSAVFVNAHRPYQNNGGLPFHFSPVQSVTSHAGFNDTTNENDVAVIQMAECVNTTEFPPAIPANPSMNISHNLMADILGFGKLSEYGSMFVNVETLQIARVPVIPTEQCSDNFYGYRIKADMLCGGYAGGGSDACQGDSGSSMTFDTSDGSTVILGVISWGVGCGRSDSPGVYASVQYHYDWIARQVCGEPETNISWCEDYSIAPTMISSSPSDFPSDFPSMAPTEIETESEANVDGESGDDDDDERKPSSFPQQKGESKQRTDTESPEEIIATTRSSNIAVLVGEDRSGASLSFWDPTGGCKTAGHECSDGNECCSETCQAGSCVPRTIVDAMAKRKRTRGARVKKHKSE